MGELMELAVRMVESLWDFDVKEEVVDAFGESRYSKQLEEGAWRAGRVAVAKARDGVARMIAEVGLEGKIKALEDEKRAIIDRSWNMVDPAEETRRIVGRRLEMDLDLVKVELEKEREEVRRLEEEWARLESKFQEDRDIVLKFEEGMMSTVSILGDLGYGEDVA